tara:strand:- start:17739 stop:18782 length:1044 start_codon:yes stop_codon:yes gene_type:complete
MFIKNTKISINSRPFIIAEISGNHKGSLRRALKIIKQAHKAGVSAIKLQTFDLDEMTLDSERSGFVINDANSLWYKKKLYDLYKIAQTPKSWHYDIFRLCKKLNLICFSSVFDLKSLNFLKKLKCPAFKIASFENNHLPLIESVAATGKPVIISTGMAKINEIDQVVKIFKKNKNKNFALLKCTSTYPSDPKETNLLGIKKLKNRYKCEVGLSDHTIGIGASVASISLGATIIEKHIVLKKRDGSVDGEFSLDPSEFKKLVNETNNAWLALGKNKIQPSEKEKKSLIFRRSIYVVENVKKGEILSEKNLKVIRPGNGLHPKHYNKIIGKKFKRNISKGTPLNINLYK